MKKVRREIVEAKTPAASEVSKTPRAQPAGTPKMGRCALPDIRKKRECVGHPARAKNRAVAGARDDYGTISLAVAVSVVPV
jgi:hypothetical protein